MSPFRIGNGYDIHRLTVGRDLILGGIHIPHEMGLDVHSDADVLTHAIMDALLGALSLGDIGHYFPPTDPEWPCSGWMGSTGCANDRRYLVRDGWVKKTSTS